ECTATGNSGNLRASYTNIAGTTVTAFSQRVREIFSIRPFMVMPDGNSGGFALPVTFSMPETPVAVEALPENTLLQERLTTLARSMQLKMDWQEVSNSFTDEDGNTIQPPWKEYDLQILTTLPAHQVAEHFSEPSVRFISVTRQLEEGRFRYQFTGKYYVQ
ncbi:type 4b pilus protein PilO2, partial [Escherichia coli]|nr:type 4b pilus protein PilO2 [Escherichia coli]